MKKGTQVIALEVKSGRLRESLSGLTSFTALFDGSRQMLVGRDGIPVETFLSKPVREWFQKIR